MSLLTIYSFSQMNDVNSLLIVLLELFSQKYTTTNWLDWWVLNAYSGMVVCNFIKAVVMNSFFFFLCIHYWLLCHTSFILWTKEFINICVDKVDYSGGTLKNMHGALLNLLHILRQQVHDVRPLDKSCISQKDQVRLDVEMRQRLDSVLE